MTYLCYKVSMKKLAALMLISSFALSSCASLVNNDIFSKSKPDPNEAYEDPNNTDELRKCVRKKKKDPQNPDCFLKNR